MTYKAQLVGGPLHGEVQVADFETLDVVLSTPLAGNLESEIESSFHTGTYVARRANPSGLVYLDNGNVPFDYYGPGGPTWHERTPPWKESEANERSLKNDLAQWCVKVSNTLLKDKNQQRAKINIRGADGERYDLRIKRLGKEMSVDELLVENVPKEITWLPSP